MKDKIVNLYGKEFYMKESTKGTCGSDEDGYTCCAFFDVSCAETEHGSLCGCMQDGAGFYFIEVKNV